MRRSIRHIITLLLLLTLCSCGSLKQEKPLSKSAPAQLNDEMRGRFDQFFLEAVRQKQLGHYQEAFDLYQHCLDINPCDAATLFEMSQFYVYLKQNDKALECMKRAVEYAPDNYWYLQSLANYYSSRNMKDESIEVCEEISRRFPKRIDILPVLCSLYAGKNDFNNVIATLNRIEANEGKSEETSLNKYRAYTSLGNQKKAFAEMESLVKEYPNDYRYKNVLGDLYLEQNDTLKSIEIYKEILADEPSYPMTQSSLVVYYDKLGHDVQRDSMLHELLYNSRIDPETRSDVARSVIEFNESKGDTMKNVVLLDSLLAQPFAEGDFASFCALYVLDRTVAQDTLRPILQRILELAPDEVMARARMLDWAVKANDADEIINLCRPGVEYNPDIPAFPLYLAIALFQRDQTQEAREVLEKAVTMVNQNTDPEVATELYAILGDIYHESDLADLAYEAYDSALVYKQDNIGVLNNYAYYLSLESRELDRAEEMSYRTVKMEPTNWTYLDTYAWILFMEKRYTEAKIYIDEALNNGGKAHADIIEHGGDIYSKCGEMTRAVELWKEARDAGSQSTTLNRKIKQKRYIE